MLPEILGRKKNVSKRERLTHKRGEELGRGFIGELRALRKN